MSKTTEKLIRDANKARATLAVLSDPLLADLVRRAGVRATSEPKAVEGPRAKGSYSDPTLNAVVRRMSSAKAADPVWDAVSEIATMLNDVASLCRSIDQRISFVTETGERVKQSTIVHCGACQREIAGTPKDRIRSGYCQSCYASWLRAGRPYRSAFERQIFAKISEESQKASNYKEKFPKKIS